MAANGIPGWEDMHSMDQTTDAQSQPVSSAVSTQAPSVWILGAAVLVGGIIVWQLRQPWAKDAYWPWLALLIVMAVAANALRQLDLWLPGQPILPKLAQFPSRTVAIIGTFWIVVAVTVIWIVVRHLLPDYKNDWHGMPQFWLASMVLIVTGAWMLGAIGKGSPRAATPSRIWTDSSRNRWLEVAAFILIFALAIFLRTYKFNSIPPGIYVDETNGALDSLYILEGRSASPFDTGWYGTPNGYIYYMAGIFKLLGANWLSLKLASLIPAILTVAAVYFLARLVFGPLTGLLAMFLMAVSRWHLSMSRWGWNETAPPLFQILATFFLIRGLRDRRASDYALSGILMGLSIYTYLSARLAVATLLIYIIYWILSDPSGIGAALRRSWQGFLIFGIAVAIAIAPIAVTYFKDPFTMNNRVAEISVFREIRDQNSLKPLIDNLGDTLKFFHQTGDHQGKHNLPDEPMTDPFTGLFFAIGFAYSILRWRDQRYFLLLLWLILGLAGSFLSSHSESPQSYRALSALPAVMLMAADMLDKLTRAIHRVVQERIFTNSRPAMPVYFAGAFAVLILTGSAAWETHVYFGRQANSVEVERGFNPTENGVARAVIDSLKANKEVYLSPTFSEYSQLRFLVYGIVKSQTGKNSLDDRPYHTIIPETDLPVTDTGKDVLILLDSTYWPLRDYVASFYPRANLQLKSLSDGSPLYFQIEIPHTEISALQGLAETITYEDGHEEQHSVPSVKVDPQFQQITRIEWAGAIHIEHGGIYQIKGEGGLDLFIDNLPITNAQYFGRGLYRLKAVWNAGDSPDARLAWQMPNENLAPVPANVLFRAQEEPQGLLGVYWNNINWENAPVFHQITPFLLLAWNSEQPIVPNGEFSARYKGSLKISEAGTYTFRIEADDGARLVIDGNVLGEGMTAGQPNSFEATADLSAGGHPIEIDYFQQGGGTALRFFWRRGDQSFTPVPPFVLTPAQP